MLNFLGIRCVEMVMCNVCESEPDPADVRVSISVANAPPGCTESCPQLTARSSSSEDTVADVTAELPRSMEQKSVPRRRDVWSTGLSTGMARQGALQLQASDSSELEHEIPPIRGFSRLAVNARWDQRPLINTDRTHYTRYTTYDTFCTSSLGESVTTDDASEGGSRTPQMMSIFSKKQVVTSPKSKAVGPQVSTISTTASYGQVKAVGPQVSTISTTASYGQVASNDRKATLLSHLHGGPSAAKTIMTMSSAQKASEQQRVQEMVNEFVYKAVKGVKCLYFLDGITRKSAHYRIDKHLKYLTIASSDAGVTWGPVRCRIMSIEDVLVLDDPRRSIADAFPPEILGAIVPDERQRLLMVAHKDEEGHVKKVFLLQESKELREIFRESVTILSMSEKAERLKGQGQ